MSDSLSKGLSFDPTQSRFLLVGTSVYDRDPENLQQLPSVLNNLTALKKILVSTDIVGAPESSVIIVPDPRDKAELSARLIEAATQANDLFLFYYAGHGVLGRETNQLYLGTVATTEEHADFDGFPFEEVRLILSSKTKAKKRVLILDCCFSGRALDDTMGTVNSAVDSNIAIKSTYSIASAPPNRLSIAEPGKQYTAFSGELIDLLESGTGGTEKYLSADFIFETLKDRLSLRPHVPEPRRKSLYDGGVLVLARNRIGPPSTKAQLDTFYRLTAERITAIESNIEELRKELHVIASTQEPKQSLDDVNEQTNSIEKEPQHGFWKSLFSKKTRFDGALPLKIWNDMPPYLQSFLDHQYAAYISSRWIIAGALITSFAYWPLLKIINTNAASARFLVFVFYVNLSLQLVMTVFSINGLVKIAYRGRAAIQDRDIAVRFLKVDFVRKAVDNPAYKVLGIPVTFAGLMTTACVCAVSSLITMALVMFAPELFPALVDIQTTHR